MGRWLNALKNLENDQKKNCQNCQNLENVGFVGFVSEVPDDIEKISEPENRIFEGFEGLLPETKHKNSETRERVLSVLSVPISSKYENFTDREPPFPALSVKSDTELYADALCAIGPCGYGPVARYLGWGATRAGQVETELRLAGRIVYDRYGRGRMADE